jgi:hypothetical protein
MFDLKRKPLLICFLRRTGAMAVTKIPKKTLPVSSLEFTLETLPCPVAGAVSPIFEIT